MDSLTAVQSAVYQVLSEYGRCFVRLCATNDALWISDYPRHGGRPDEAQAALRPLGVCCRLDERTKLWKLDFQWERYRLLDKRLPKTPPPPPEKQEQLEAYALCRLLLAHPSPLDAQPMALIREVMKLPAKPVGEQRRGIQGVYGQCARLLRTREPLPSMAGGLLCVWLAHNH